MYTYETYSKEYSSQKRYLSIDMESFVANLNSTVCSKG